MHILTTPAPRLSEHSKALRRMEREAKAKQKDVDTQNLQQPQQLPSPPHPQSSVPLPVPSSTQPSSATSSAFPPSVPPAGVPGPPGPVALPPAPVVPSSYHRSSPPKLDPIHMGGGLPPAHHTHTHTGSIGNASAISPSHSQPQPPLSATSLVQSPFDLRYSQPPPQTAHSTSSFHDTKPGTAGGESADDSTPDMEDNIYPARIVDRETKRLSYFRTILNPSNGALHSRRPKEAPTRAPTPPPRSANVDLNVRDPITAGILDEQTAVWLLDQCV